MIGNKKNITIAFYNVENFFDTIDNPDTNDEEYLPSAIGKWDETKYLNKINHIAKVVTSTVDGPHLPAAVGFCEIENRQVLCDLIEKSNLKEKKYISLCSTGMDKRGINVGLIFDETIFEFIHSEELNVVNNMLPDYKTRNILFITLKFKETDDLVHFFINHWPSRSHDTIATEPKRIYAAQVLRNKIDELQKQNANAKIIVMGDLNDSPNNNSILNTLLANDQPKAGSGELLNPYLELYQKKEGSHIRNGVWELFDNIILSQGFLASNGLNFKRNNKFILDKNFVLFKNNKTGEKQLKTTYSDNKRYVNGYSDHLAVYVKLEY